MKMYITSSLKKSRGPNSSDSSFLLTEWMAVSAENNYFQKIFGKIYFKHTNIQIFIPPTCPTEGEYKTDTFVYDSIIEFLYVYVTGKL